MAPGASAAGLTMGLSASGPSVSPGPRQHVLAAAELLRPVGVGEGRHSRRAGNAPPRRSPGGFAMRSSITGWKRLIKPCTGQAAASPKAQIVWPSIWRDTSSKHADFPHVRVVVLHAFQERLEPPRTLATRRALAARLVSIESGTVYEWPRSCPRTCP